MLKTRKSRQVFVEAVKYGVPIGFVIGCIVLLLYVRNVDTWQWPNNPLLIAVLAVILVIGFLATWAAMIIAGLAVIIGICWGACKLVKLTQHAIKTWIDAGDKTSTASSSKESPRHKKSRATIEREQTREPRRPTHKKPPSGYVFPPLQQD